MTQITLSEEQLQALIRDAVKQEIEATNKLNRKKSSPYIFQEVLDEYIKNGGQLSDVAGTGISWKLWDMGIRRLVVIAMGKAYVRDIDDKESAKKLAKNLCEVLVEHYKELRGRR